MVTMEITYFKVLNVQLCSAKFHIVNLVQHVAYKAP